MTRRTLGQLSGERKRFQALFARIGKKQTYTGHSEDTILLQDVTDVETGLKVADHVWFVYSLSFQKIRMTPGDRIAFDARVVNYKKGYINRPLGRNQRTEDFKLSHPTRIAIVKG